MIPSVAKNDNNKPMSPPMNGFNTHIIKVAKPREFKESGFLEKTNPNKYIIDIIPDLTTDGRKPVMPMNNKIPKQVNIVAYLLDILRTETNKSNKN